MINGKIIKGIGGFYYVDTEKGLYECRARGIFRKNKITPLVGDRVSISVVDEENKKGVVEEIEKRDTELVDTWLDAMRNLRNYCAHNSMVVGMNSSVALLDPVDDAKILPEDNDLYSRLYALKKLIPAEDKEKLKKDIQRLIKRTSLDINLLGILPENWEEMYDQITEF